MASARSGSQGSQMRRPWFLQDWPIFVRIGEAAISRLSPWSFDDTLNHGTLSLPFLPSQTLFVNRATACSAVFRSAQTRTKEPSQS